MPNKKTLKQIAANIAKRAEQNLIKQAINPAIAGASPAQPKRNRKRRRNRKAKRQGVMSVSAPIAESSVITNKNPRFSSRSGNFCVKHREYITDITGSVNFTVNKYAVNPGLNNLFPWLANIANQYESYLFRKLHFVYEPACSTVTPGSVMLAVDFDASDPDPIGKVQMMAYNNAVRSPAWEAVTYLIVTGKQNEAS